MWREIIQSSDLQSHSSPTPFILRMALKETLRDLIVQPTVQNRQGSIKVHSERPAELPSRSISRDGDTNATDYTHKRREDSISTINIIQLRMTFSYAWQTVEHWGVIQRCMPLPDPGSLPPHRANWSELTCMVWIPLHWQSGIS